MTGTIGGPESSVVAASLARSTVADALDPTATTRRRPTSDPGWIVALSSATSTVAHG
ncbi:hypothetical protein [Gordonia insulae]|uniref:hypothetical protein n=1 Tax=Gordonia insulae TaxID=2420509 RepID=UPI001E40A497|nr:hypothetical protein [Gordonia insulae]